MFVAARSFGRDLQHTLLVGPSPGESYDISARGIGSVLDCRGRRGRSRIVDWSVRWLTTYKLDWQSGLVRYSKRIKTPMARMRRSASSCLVPSTRLPL